jgi:demethylmenaquinone methyltransferase/2-methoxy-6-polyprenyl-1,4-benzoquinol methylase
MSPEKGKATGASFLTDSFHAPLGPGIRDALVGLFDMRRPDAEVESSDGQTDFRRLCQPDSPDFILDISDYYAFFTHTLFWGKTAK